MPNNRRSLWYLPAEPFRQRVIEWAKTQPFNAVYEQAMERAVFGRRPEWHRLAPREYLGIHIGVSRAWMDKFLEGRYASLHFDVADRLMCAMNIAHEWLTTDPFKELYATVDLAELDRRKPVQDAKAA